MTVELGFLWFAECLMIGAFVCFVRGFLFRKTDLAAHMFWNKLGACAVFAGLVAVEVLARVAGWEFPIRSRPLLRVHIGVATVALTLLITLVVTGMLRIRKVHVKLYWLFFPAYVSTVVLSWFAFQLW